MSDLGVVVLVYATWVFGIFFGWWLRGDMIRNGDAREVRRREEDK